MRIIGSTYSIARNRRLGTDRLCWPSLADVLIAVPAVQASGVKGDDLGITTGVGVLEHTSSGQ